MRLILLGFCAVVAVSLAGADAPKTVYLWPEGAPNAHGTEDVDKPSLLIYPAPAEKANGAAVIIAPGGGYNILAIDHEGQQVARWFNRFGVTAFVLKYRLKTAKYQVSDALLDGKRAVRWVRANAKEMGVDPNRVGMMGFSAGAHLAACVSIDADAGKTDAADAIEKQGCKPNFICLIYGGATALNAPKNPAPNDPPLPSFTKDSPPAFMMCSEGDKSLPHALEVFKTIQAAGVDAEFHVYGGWGPHGLGLASGEAGLGTWPELAKIWMHRLNFLTNEPRAAVKGVLTLDGEVVRRAWVTFVPIGSETRPIAATHFGGTEKGTYKLAANFGPCPGPHKVVIRVLAKTSAVEPTIEDEIILTKLTPGGDELKVDVKAGENEFNFDLKTK